MLALGLLGTLCADTNSIAESCAASSAQLDTKPSPAEPGTSTVLQAAQGAAFISRALPMDRLRSAGLRCRTKDRHAPIAAP